jgi:hypothetical protein
MVTPLKDRISSVPDYIESLETRGKAGAAEALLVRVDVKLIVFSEQLQRVDPVGQLDPDPTKLAGVLATAVNEIFARHFDERCGLVASAG